MSEEIRKRNIRNILFGWFFGAIAAVLISFFLPFYLKERGLTILQNIQLTNLKNSSHQK